MAFPSELIAETLTKGFGQVRLNVSLLLIGLNLILYSLIKYFFKDFLPQFFYSLNIEIYFFQNRLQVQ